MLNGHKDNHADREYLEEKNDCTVRALANASEIPYLEAYGMMLGIGRKRGRGIHCQEMYNTLFGKPYERPGMIVENFVKYIGFEGNWIVEIRGHVFAVKNGVVIDLYPQGVKNCHVKQAWRVK